MSSSVLKISFQEVQEPLQAPGRPRGGGRPVLRVEQLHGRVCQAEGRDDWVERTCIAGISIAKTLRNF